MPREFQKTILATALLHTYYYKVRHISTKQITTFYNHYHKQHHITTSTTTIMYFHYHISTSCTSKTIRELRFPRPNGVPDFWHGFGEHHTIFTTYGRIITHAHGGPWDCARTTMVAGRVHLTILLTPFAGLGPVELQHHRSTHVPTTNTTPNI